jgi:methylenetetrahydrofolate reductase (NADPH)
VNCSTALLQGSEPTKPRFSFEVFPARSGMAALALGNAVQHLASVQPDFISVTYGASGSNRDATGDLLRHIRRHTSALPMAHLTTVATARSELEQIVHGLMDDGIHDFLALRGDIPNGMKRSDDAVAASPTSAELLEIIADARAQRPAFSSVGRTAVAAYPNGHPDSRSRTEDLEWLAYKERAGASMAITQLFFYADEYLSFVEDARAAGITLPILPGIMPVSTSAQLRKVAMLADQPAPRELTAAMDDAGGYAPELGVAFARDLCREVIAGGAPSLHLYTFNRHEQVLAVLRELGILVETSSV